MSDWQKDHGKVINSFLSYLNENTDNFILKGGTALSTCYDLDRFSEDIDLDGKGEGIEEIIDYFCKSNGYSFRIAKDTDTVKRYMLNYGNDRKPLKIEASFRRKEIADEEVKTINGIKTYGIDALCIMKINAYSSRDKIRDLYDLTFICKNYYDNLSPQTISLLRSAIEYKGIEQFDYIMQDQADELIDEKQLAHDFLLMFDRLGLLYDDREGQIIQSYEKN